MYATSGTALLHQYQNDSVMTASPMELIIMLYDGMIKQIKLAEIFLEDKDYEKVNRALTKAEDIVNELLASLDLSYPISQELMRLYDFMLQELVEINLHKDASRIEPLLEIIFGLREAWGAVRNQEAHVYATVEE